MRRERACADARGAREPENIVVNLELQQHADMRLVRLARPPMAESARNELGGELDVTGRHHPHAQVRPALLVVAVEWRQAVDAHVIHQRVVAREFVAGAAHLGLELVGQLAKRRRVRTLAVKRHEEVAEDAVHVQQRLLPSRRRTKDADDGNLAQLATGERRRLKVERLDRPCRLHVDVHQP
jgi:hypothetical protein